MKGHTFIALALLLTHGLNLMAQTLAPPPRDNAAPPPWNREGNEVRPEIKLPTIKDDASGVQELGGVLPYTNAANPVIVVTNTLRLSPEAGYRKLKSAKASNDVESYYVFDVNSGTYRGIVVEHDTQTQFIFDMSGMFNGTVIEKKTKDGLNVFDPDGKWLFFVRDGKSLFKPTGEYQGAIGVNGSVVTLAPVDKQERGRRRKPIGNEDPYADPPRRP